MAIKPLPIHLDKRRKVSDEDADEMRLLHRKGLSYEKIADIFGVTDSTVNYWVNPEWRRKKIELSSNDSYERYHFEPEYKLKHKEAQKRTEKRHGKRLKLLKEEYRKLHPEKVNEASKNWRDKNKEKIKQLNKQYWNDYKERKYYSKMIWTWKIKLRQAKTKNRLRYCREKIKHYQTLKFKNQ